VLRLHEWGSGNGVPLLYWHGLNPFGALELNEARPAWAEQGFRVVAFAAPGIADEETLPDPRDYRPARLADLIITTADIARSVRPASRSSSVGPPERHRS